MIYALGMSSDIVCFSYEQICCDCKANYSEAPVLKEVDTSLHKVTFNGSLLKTNIFRQDAGPEVDAAWDSLGVGCKKCVAHVTHLIRDLT